MSGKAGAIARNDRAPKAVNNSDGAVDSAPPRRSQAYKHGEVTFTDRRCASAWRAAWANARAWTSLGWRP
jgi:hypothetical protein